MMVQDRHLNSTHIPKYKCNYGGLTFLYRPSENLGNAISQNLAGHGNLEMFTERR